MRIKRKDRTYGPTGIPELPSPIDDNAFLAAATQAADQDKASGAYDEFLFSEDGIDQMPYERAVDDRLALAQMRLLDQGRRVVLEQKHELLRAETEVVAAAQRHFELDEQIASREVELQTQREILSGNQTGKHGLYWKGTPPEQTSIFNGWLRLAMPYFVFVLVGCVDIFIIYLSFFNLDAFGQIEAIAFTLPTVGVQLVFPHLIGNRLGLLLHGDKRKIANIVEASVLFIVWISFAIFLTVLRMNYFDSEDPQAPEFLRFAMTIGNFLILLGLGGWLLLLAARHNPHETSFSRLNFALSLLRKRQLKAKRKSPKHVPLSQALRPR